MFNNSEFRMDFDQQKLDQAITRAWVDAEYRKWLISNPKDALLEEGVELPEEVTVVVHEFDINERHIFLPPTPQSSDASKNLKVTPNRPPNTPRTEPRPVDALMIGVARPFLVPPAFEKREE